MSLMVKFDCQETSCETHQAQFQEGPGMLAYCQSGQGYLTPSIVQSTEDSASRLCISSSENATGTLDQSNLASDRSNHHANTMLKNKVTCVGADTCNTNTEKHDTEGL